MNEVNAARRMSVLTSRIYRKYRNRSLGKTMCVCAIIGLVISTKVEEVHRKAENGEKLTFLQFFFCLSQRNQADVDLPHTHKQSNETASLSLSLSHYVSISFFFSS